MEFAGWVLAAAGTYLATGLFLGIAFVALGVARVDPAAQGSPIAFRLLILPGTVALWPLVVAWWVRTFARNGRS